MATTARLSVAQRLVTDAWCALALALLALILLAAPSTSEAAPQGPWSLPAIDLSAAEQDDEVGLGSPSLRTALRQLSGRASTEPTSPFRRPCASPEAVSDLPRT